jgi:hypothetical protein
MSHFDAYVESLLHFNLNFYLAFSPERGRTIGELVTVISSALARSGVACTANEVNQSIERRIAFNDGFVQTAHDKIWLNFAATSTVPSSPTPMAAATVARESENLPAASTDSDAVSTGWEQQIWRTEFAAVASVAHDINAADFPIRLLTSAYGKLRNVASDPYKNDYLKILLDVLNNLVPGSKLNRLSLDRVVTLKKFGETSTKPVKLASSRVVSLLTGWIAEL